MGTRLRGTCCRAGWVARNRARDRGDLRCAVLDVGGAVAARLPDAGVRPLWRWAARGRRVGRPPSGASVRRGTRLDPRRSRALVAPCRLIRAIFAATRRCWTRGWAARPRSCWARSSRRWIFWPDGRSAAGATGNLLPVIGGNGLVPLATGCQWSEGCNWIHPEPRSSGTGNLLPVAPGSRLTCLADHYSRHCGRPYRMAA